MGGGCLVDSVVIVGVDCPGAARVSVVSLGGDPGGAKRDTLACQFGQEKRLTASRAPTPVIEYVRPECAAFSARKPCRIGPSLIGTLAFGGGVLWTQPGAAILPVVADARGVLYLHGCPSSTTRVRSGGGAVPAGSGACVPSLSRPRSVLLPQARFHPLLTLRPAIATWLSGRFRARPAGLRRHEGSSAAPAGRTAARTTWLARHEGKRASGTSGEAGAAGAGVPPFKSGFPAFAARSSKIQQHDRKRRSCGPVSS